MTQRGSYAYAWYTVILLTVAYVFSFVDRYILGLLVEPIKADLGLTDTEIGLLLGPAFALFYTTMGLPLGWLADRTRRTWLVGAGIAVWSLATAACGLARNFVQLFIARMSVGVGEATLSPCALSMIADSFPEEKRGKPVAFYTAALSLGAGIASLAGASVLAWSKSMPVNRAAADGRARAVAIRIRRGRPARITARAVDVHAARARSGKTSAMSVMATAPVFATRSATCWAADGCSADSYRSSAS